MKRLRGKKTLRIVSYLRSRYLANRFIKTIDLERFKIYQQKYHAADPRPHGYSKYLDIKPWLADKLMHAFYLGLDKGKPLKILDIGTGTGYFPYICRQLGHEVVSLDLDVVPMYNDLCQFLKVNRKTWRVEKFQKLPDLGMKFDFVTAFMIKFNNHYREDLWRTAEWKFMLEDLHANQLNPNGRVFLSFNTNLDGTHYDDDLRRYFESLGGKIWHNEVDIGGPKPSAVFHFMDKLLGVETPMIHPSPQ